MKKKELLEILDSHVQGCMEMAMAVRQAKARNDTRILEGIEYGLMQLASAIKGLYLRLSNEPVEEESEEEKAAEQIKGEEIEVGEKE